MVSIIRVGLLYEKDLLCSFISFAEVLPVWLLYYFGHDPQDKQYTPDW